MGWLQSHTRDPYVIGAVLYYDGMWIPTPTQVRKVHMTQGTHAEYKQSCRNLNEIRGLRQYQHPGVDIVLLLFKVLPLGKNRVTGDRISPYYFLQPHVNL